MNRVTHHFIFLCIFATGPLCLSSGAFGERSKTIVRIDFIEALDSKDNDYSERFRKEFESAIAEGVEASKSRLAKCGYEIQSERRYFEKSDPLKAKELAATSESSGSWLIVAPSRSNHYLLTAAGAPKTPSISILASSKQVFDLPPTHLTLSHSNKELAIVAAEEAMRRISAKQSKSYVSIVSADCTTCVDFAAEFKINADRLEAKQAEAYEVNGEDPNIENVRASLSNSATKPSFILLPNYSMVSARLMAKLVDHLPRETFFVGSDGWGTSKFGYVQNANGLGNAVGFSVRSFPSAKHALAFIPHGKALVAQNRVRNFESTSAVGVFKILDSLEQMLCKSRPKSSAEFRSIFAKNGPELFRPEWRPSIYSLKSGNIVFEKIAEGALEK